MKRFLLFASEMYYPGGGMHDFQGSFDTLDEATAALSSAHIKEWSDLQWHVYDRDLNQIAAAGGEDTFDVGDTIIAPCSRRTGAP